MAPPVLPYWRCWWKPPPVLVVAAVAVFVVGGVMLAEGYFAVANAEAERNRIEAEIKQREESERPAREAAERHRVLVENQSRDHVALMESIRQSEAEAEARHRRRMTE